MTKLETLNKEEWEQVFNIINYQIRTNEEVLENLFIVCEIDKEEILQTKKELELLKSAKRKLSNIAKRELIIAYD